VSNKKIVNLKVNGIHCDGCASKIKKSLDTLNIEHVTEVNTKTGQVKIIFDADKAGLSDIKSKITDVGFQIESVELE
jgi:copper chaperone CopZ